MSALSRSDTVLASDLFVIFKGMDIDYRAASASAMLAYIQGNLVFPGNYVTQYSAPAATGFTVTIPDVAYDVHLILTPLAGYAAGTLKLPLSLGCSDGQRLLVNCTQAITTLSVTLNGAAAAVGIPTTLAANAFFTMKYDKASNNWYRVG
jgi:hypothetical protein